MAGRRPPTLSLMSHGDLELLVRTDEEQADEDAFQRLYGAWAPLTPDETARTMAGFSRPWWIVGGWAIDAATGIPREHEDLDVSVLACDVPRLYDHLKGHWHLWNNVGGTLTPLSDTASTVSDPSSQIWVRKEAKAPWVMDIVLTPDKDGLWVSKRDPEHVAPIEEVTWVHADGIRYQVPEIVLLYKAALARPKDERDLRLTWDRMSGVAREWLRNRVSSLYPDHPWNALIQAFDSAKAAPSSNL
jgi:hypothetical protein